MIWLERWQSDCRILKKSGLEMFFMWIRQILSENGGIMEMMLRSSPDRAALERRST